MAYQNSAYTSDQTVSVQINNTKIECYSCSMYSFPTIIRIFQKENESKHPVAETLLTLSVIAFALAFPSLTPPGSQHTNDITDDKDDDKNMFADVPVLELSIPNSYSPGEHSLYKKTSEHVYLFDNKYQDTLSAVFNRGHELVEKYKSPTSDYEKSCMQLYKTGAIYTGGIQQQEVMHKCRYMLVPPDTAKNIVHLFFDTSSSIIFVNSIEDIANQINSQLQNRKKQEEKKRQDEEKRRQKENEQRQHEQEEAEAKRRDEIKRQQQQFEADFLSRKNEITWDFSNTQLLSQDRLTRSQKVDEYAKVIAFCNQYIPNIKKTGTHLESLLPPHPSPALLNYCSTFSRTWWKIFSVHKGLRLGIDGERRVANLLNIYHDRLSYISEYTNRVEHDFIILSPYGIYTVEVKNLSGEYVLSASGILKCLSNPRKKIIDVAFQSKKHVEDLRRTLKNCTAYKAKIPIQHIICSANQEYTIDKNDYPYIPVCYTNTLDNYVLNNELPVVMSTRTMEEIKNYLLAHQEPPFTFPVTGSRGEIVSQDDFISTFAAFAARLELEK